MTLKTKHRQEKEAKEMAFYTDYMEMTAPNRNGEKVVDIDPVMNVLMKRYGIYARSTCYAIIHRVEKRLGGAGHGK